MNNQYYCEDVCAVLVTYNPKLELLDTIIQLVRSQVSDIFIVDNASKNLPLDWLYSLEGLINVKLHLIQQEENVGLGAAHNIGIRHAVQRGANFILILDQDSEVELDLVFKLRSAYAALNEKGFQVAGLGSQYRNSENNTLSKFAKVGFLRFNSFGNNNETIVDADFLISSGSLLSVKALEVVGQMDESLFIDHVDTEWFFRAKSKGFKVFGLCGAVITHELGEQSRDLYLWRKLTIHFHQPFRYYYMFRNSILLYRRGYMPLSWKFADFVQRLKMIIYFSLARENRFEILKMMCLGIIDGLRSKSGKRDGL